jgi:uncharacterized protein (TIGR03435 family)
MQPAIRPSLAILLAAFPAFGQQPAKLAFEAVAIHPAEQASGMIAPLRTRDPVRVGYRNYVLKKIIMEAYQVSRYQVEGPVWTERDRFDISATTLRGATEEQVRLMPQAMLAERFHLSRIRS